MNYIIRLHGVHVTTVSHFDARFTSESWEAFLKAMSTKFLFLSGTTFHPQTNGQSERIIQTLVDMLCLSILQFLQGYGRHLSLFELRTRIFIILVWLWYRLSR